MIDPKRQEIVDTARSVLGVRWRHQGRDPEVGLDCAGLIIWTGWQTGLMPEDFDYQGYQREPDGKTLAQALARTCERVLWPNWSPGDIVLLRDIATIWPCHLGILAERPGSECPNLIHSWAKMRRRVVEARFDDEWASRLQGLYKYRGIT